jgi:hypothetical protein
MGKENTIKVLIKCYPTTRKHSRSLRLLSDSDSDPDPGSDAFLTLDPDPGSGIGFFRILDPNPIFFRA